MTEVHNFINGEFVPPSTGQYLAITSPHDGKVCGKVAVSSSDDVAKAVAAAKAALPGWKSLTVKSRAAKMFKLHHLIQQHAEELAKLATLENGKTLMESLAEVAKGNETCEWACSLPQIMQGRTLMVSRGVQCQDQLDPVGVVASIVPFNFPMMVPMWTVPIALTVGNVVICKPSEKCPLTMNLVAKLMKEAGIPDGVFQIVNGQVDAVNSIVDHPDVAAVTFVGSSKVAEIVYKRVHALGKKVLSLGGAKNHLIANPDRDIDMTATDITSSFAGCAGQRCMAASVLLTIGEQPELLDAIVAKASNLKPGQGAGNMGPVIDTASKERILKYIDEAEAAGAKILLDGRDWAEKEGSWVGPTIILHSNPADAALHDEIFGPVLSVLVVANQEEAIRIENANPYGNAAAIYTQSGGVADWFSQRFRAGMIGVNIGIPVPREPFSFGGMYGTLSKFGEHDITGEGAMRFFTTRKKITTKWAKFETGKKEDISQFK
mmetsp:Transcript_3050/g.3633  ORF Transcript_3050/g.3633 Transcript_3050/m.3633 type:complete len:491 (+) Transcript_3050:155-1627(+)|eukprot:CAMPEP_0184016854 /NCGR_PEP_ID=MMETSP0954-20121128/7170_1 /TAXON_ID=627963 /ORGANISM="Aplanochytrium sp, Strain PBS07" /LENGTH=490 /DNA_ID=CAMNT_0026297941 /DNA_START=42 /DNA_END=1514 /DNA_ORIENTATION=-